MTAVSLRGMEWMVRRECQSKVAMDTKIITATRAAIGMIATTGPRATTRTSSSAPDRNVDSRVRAPDFTLIMVWPIIAQPPMPPKRPEAMLAMPRPQDSRVLFDPVSVTSSTSLAVIRDSMSPTKATPNANGAMIVRVSRVSGTVGMPKNGQASGSAPWSPTVGTSDAGGHDQPGEHHDGHQRRRNRLGEAGEAEDDHQAGGDHGVDQPGHVGQVGQLGGEDQDGQGVDEPDHHRPGDESHQLGEPGEGQHDLEHPAQHDRGQQVAHPVLQGQRRHHQRDGAGGAGDHGWSATGEGDDHSHHEAGVQTHAGVDAGQDGEADRLGDQGQGHDQAGEDLGAGDLG